MIPLKIGADPEFFLMKKDKFISAHNIVPGTKRKPYPLRKGALQVDGTAVEFNIDPAESPEEFSDNISTVLGQVREMVPKEFEFKFLPSVEYDPPYFKRIPTKAKLLGCEPDFNAYKEGAMNQPPQDVGTMRTGAGHIHVGWGSGMDVKDPSHMWDCIQTTQILDRTIGRIAPVWDKDAKRRMMYGQPGSFRPKSYGVEYRVLSNAWLSYHKLWPWLFRTIKHQVEYTYNSGYVHSYTSPGTTYTPEQVNYYCIGHPYPQMPPDWRK